MIKKITLLAVLLLTFSLFKNYPLVSVNIIKACDLFLNKIFPSLFPMFIISSMLINLNFIKYVNFFFGKLCIKLFRLNNNTSYIFFMSIISGFPSNAKIAMEMYDMHLIDINDVQKIILFSHFSNPLFIMGMIKDHTLLVLFAHYISNVIIGIIIRNKYISQKVQKEVNPPNIKLAEALTTSINSAISTLLFILGTIVTFFIISSIINIPFFNVILELSQGLNYLNTLNLSLKLKTLISGFLLSFGGICIHFQVYGILNKLNIRYIPYLFSRLFHALLTVLIIIIFY